MIIKFCYENEIHRCSDPPRDFSLLYNFLVTMFRTAIPQQIDLSYVNPAGQTIFINTQDDYENLMKNEPSKTVKILISEKKQPLLQAERDESDERIEVEAVEYEVIPNYQEEQREEIPEKQSPVNIIEILEENEDKNEPIRTEEEQILLLNSQSEQKEDYDEILLNKVSERISEKYVMPQVQNNPGLQPAQVKELVREALKEELPFIIAQVKETLRKEEEQEQAAPIMSKPVIPPVQQENQAENKAAPVSYQAYYSYPYYYQPPVNRVNSYPGQPVYQALPQRPQEQPQRMVYGPPVINNINSNNSPRYAPEQVHMQQQQHQQQQQQEKRPHLLDKMVNVLSGPINKATEMMDNFVQKFEGDPYVQCPEGKYNKSVVDKVAQLKDIFPEENRKDLLDFVQRFPRDAPLDQLAEVYWSKKKMA